MPLRQSREISNAYVTLKMRARHRNKKQRYVEYKGGKCELCGYSKSLAALEFHHRDPNQKDFRVSGKNVSWEKVKAELDKCQLLCANCHREEHERLMDEKHARLEHAVREVVPKKGHQESRSQRCCVTCGRTFKGFKRRLYCSSKCVPQHQTKITWPADADLQQLVWQKPVDSIAGDLGVSGAAIKKRCSSKGIATPGRGYWSKFRPHHSGVV